MEITETNYGITLSRKELKALQKGLEALEMYERLHPAIGVGFSVESKLIVDQLKRKIDKRLE